MPSATRLDLQVAAKRGGICAEDRFIYYCGIQMRSARLSKYWKRVVVCHRRSGIPVSYCRQMISQAMRRERGEAQPIPLYEPREAMAMMGTESQTFDAGGKTSLKWVVSISVRWNERTGQVEVGGPFKVKEVTL